MPDSDDKAVQEVIETFLARLDRGELAAAAALLLPDAAFTREVQGALLEFDRAAWFAFARGRDPGREGARNALLMNLSPDAAAFKVDTRLPRETLTDRVLLRRGPDGWRIASILSYP